MERRRFISDCVIKAAEELGYPTMKMEQLDVALHVWLVAASAILVRW